MPRIAEHSYPVWTCRCGCGKVKEIRAVALLTGKTRSCGCGVAGRSAAPQPPVVRSPERLTVREEASRAAFWRDRLSREQARETPIELAPSWMQ